MRFLTAKKDLSPSELHYFTTVDHHDHEALGALDHGDGRGVAIARYVRHPAEPEAAEIALTVIDDWRRFTALVAAGNAAMTGLLESLSADLVRWEYGTLTYELALGCAGPGCAPVPAR